MKTRKNTIKKQDKHVYTKKKTNKKKINKKKTNKNLINKKTIRIITIQYDDYKNDLNVYIDIFTKMGYKIDFHLMNRDERIKIKYEPNPYYDINLFINSIIPINDYNNKTNFAFFKNIFPARVNMFAPNINSFRQFRQIEYIDIVLCNNKLCHNFINTIKKENKYKFKSFYTNFTTIIPKSLLSIETHRSKSKDSKSNKKYPFIFVHLAENQKFQNTSYIIHCWLKYNHIFKAIIIDENIDRETQVSPELHISCSGISFTTLLLEIKAIYKYDLLTKYKFIKDDKFNILKYNNLYLYLDIKQNNSKYTNYTNPYKKLIDKANVFIYPNKTTKYPHNINTARYFNKFVITMNSQPMNELFGSNTKNCYLLKNENNYKNKQYKETKFVFTEMIPNIEELRDAILWCIKKGSGAINNSGSRKLFDNDKKYFENSMKMIIDKLKIGLDTKSNTLNTLNTLNTIIEQPSYKSYPESENDNHCKYLNVRGILKSCNIHSLFPVSSIGDLIGYDFDLLNIGNSPNNSSNNIYSIYVCNTAIPNFAKKLKEYSKKIHYKFILVSGDSDDTCPDDLFEDKIDFKNFIENDKIIHWYSQNCILKTHPKLTQLPIGLAFIILYDENIKEEAAKIISPIKQELFLIQTHKDALPFWKRERKCYINFNSIFNYSRSKYGYDRYEALHKIPNNIVFSEKNIVSKEITFVNQSKYAFVVSPFGNGLDTHRTWEALVLGCIPIVKTSPLDSLYTNLPVLIISDWNNINAELLENTINDFKEKHEKGKFNYDKLLLKYWVDKINEHKKM